MRFAGAFLTLSCAVMLGQSTASVTRELSLIPCDAQNLGEHVVNVLEDAFGTPDYLIDGPAWMWRDCVAIKLSPAGREYAPGVLSSALRRELSAKFHFAGHKDFKAREVLLLKQGAEPIKIQRADGCENGQIHNYFHKTTVVRTALDGFAHMLAFSLRRPVVDETGLSGCFTFDLTWTNDATVPKSVADQLGLELVNGKQPVELLVVDQINQWPPKPDNQ